jgi:nitrate/nitrite transporter NarK
MVKLFLIALIAFGAFIALVSFFPSSTHTAFTFAGHHITWVILGVCGCAYLGYKAIK